MRALLEMRGIHKTFGAVVALKGAKMEVRPGEIMALLGSNGSGKSTMIKALAGLVKPNSGDILLNGKPLVIHSGNDARRHGIATAFQDLSIVGTMTVLDNIMLGRELTGKTGFIDVAKQYSEVDALLGRLNLNIDPDAFAQTLMPSTQSMLEVAKAVYGKPKLLLLDEVTASLHNDEINTLFKLLRELRDEGVAIVYVTHRMNEIFQICDKATIMRNGETTAVDRMENLTLDDIVFHMTGSRLVAGNGHSANVMPQAPEHPAASEQPAAREQLQAPEHPAASEQPAAREQLQAPEQPQAGEYRKTVVKVTGLKIEPIVKDISLEAREGEIVGIGGLEGQGQPEVMRAILGAVQPGGGVIEYRGKRVRFSTVNDAVKQDIGFVSGERGREAVFPTRTVAENIGAGFAVRGPLSAVVLPSKIRRYAKKAVDEYKIVVGSLNHPANSLSGGNQQKLVVARWLSENPKLLLLDDPTKGVDVHSRYEIHNLLRESAKNGMTVIISSSDNEELLDLADTIYVFYEGKVSAVLRGDNKNADNLVSGMLGYAQTGAGGPAGSDILSGGGFSDGPAGGSAPAADMEDDDGA